MSMTSSSSLHHHHHLPHRYITGGRQGRHVHQPPSRRPVPVGHNELVDLSGRDRQGTVESQVRSHSLTHPLTTRVTHPLTYRLTRTLNSYIVVHTHSYIVEHTHLPTHLPTHLLTTHLVEPALSGSMPVAAGRSSTDTSCCRCHICRYYYPLDTSHNNV